MFSRADFTHDVPSWNRHCRSIQQTWVPGKGQSFQTLRLQNRACACTAPTSPFTSTPVCTAANLGSLLPWHLGDLGQGGMTWIFHMRQNPWTLVWFLLQISINKDKAVETLQSTTYQSTASQPECRAEVWHQQLCPVGIHVL